MKRVEGITRGLAAAAILFGTTVGLAQETEKAAEEKPGFRVEQDIVDVGKVKAGEDAEAVFVFVNNSDKPVKIIRAKPS